MKKTNEFSVFRRAGLGRAASLVVALAVGLSVALTVGCSARKAKPPAAPILPPAQTQDARDLAPPPAPLSAQDRAIEDTIAAARAEYRAGIEALRAGQRETARARFDRSIGLLLDSKVPAQNDPRLSETLSELVEGIHAMELEAIQSGNGLEMDDTPAEELGKIDPSITPEKAEEELEKVEQTEVTYDIPVELNPKVLAWIDIYTGSMRTRFQEGLARSGWYLPMIQRIFEEEGVPRDLAYIAHVESSYKPYAYSRARAKGVWQFISGTARRYGLRRDWWVDERSDPELATRAAAAYLKDLYEMFGDWYLAMAGYNAGEGKVQRAIQRTGTSDFWKLAQTPYLRLETKNYVPAILAALVISKSPEKFGFVDVQKNPEVVYDKVVVDDPVDLRVAARCAGTSVDELKRLNPALYRLQTPPNYPDYELRVPEGTGQAFDLVYASLGPSDRLPSQKHTVQSGETLASIAKRYGIGMTTLASANNMSRKSSLKAGTVLAVPTSLAPLTGAHPDRPGETQMARRGRSSSGVHRVARGDTLYSIAKRYGTTVEALRAANGLTSKSTLIPGRKLVIRKPGASSSSKSTPAVASRSKSGGGSAAAASSGSKVTYRVRKGDTLARIASAHGSSIEDICRWNDISRSSTLRIGSTLVLYR